jgi:hypothetical protein
MIELTNARVSWIPASGGGPVELSYCATVTMEYVRPDDFVERVISTGWFKPTTIRGRVRLTPAGYRVLIGRSHPRIRRMHSAYSHKRGRGRW